MYKNIKLFAGLQMLLLLASTQLACTQSSSTGGGADNSKVLATVNGEPITENQLVANLETLMGKKQAINQLKAAERRKILESMVMSRLIKQQAEKGFDKTQLSFYEQKARVYKEKIIVNDYLRENITSAPVSNEMVAEYYNKHPERFGAEEVLRYELLTTQHKLSEADRNQLLSVYGEIQIASEKTSDMQTLKNNIAKKGIELSYQKSVLRPGALNVQMKAILKQLEPGEVSALSMHKGRPYIFKLLERLKKPARPMSEVSAQIRKQLAPVALKKAINEQMEKLEPGAKIEYL
ncbi:hypothetical protein MNBD_GAMMA11-2302 [hydrothermal vent metagenome]|uniref:PpiC domain-containing protein n=1 Tax=hydrothermal vent metagenome TaxID=652676 RepID=A0A3B0XUH2_9ZZZZ